MRLRDRKWAWQPQKFPAREARRWLNPPFYISRSATGFVRLMLFSVGACLVFVASTERKIGLFPSIAIHISVTTCDACAADHVVRFTRPSPSVFAYCKRSKAGAREGLGTRLISRTTAPAPWCAGMVVVPKKSGEVRICVDLKPLNESVLREPYPMPKVDDTLALLSGATLFSKLDANSGFWQIPLSKESRPLTTFITPFGRFHFSKLPFGISCAPELFQRRMNQMLEGLYAADALSCAPTQGESEEELQEEVEAYVDHVTMSSIPATADRLQAYRQAQMEDAECSKVREYCQTNWPAKHSIESSLKPYWKVRGLLTLHNDLLLYNSRIVVPPSLRRETMLKIHEGHQGVERCRERVRSSVWWPGVTSQVKQFVENCRECARVARPRREPLLPTPLPDYPWQVVASDLFKLKGEH